LEEVAARIYGARLKINCLAGTLGNTAYFCAVNITASSPKLYYETRIAPFYHISFPLAGFVAEPDGAERAAYSTSYLQGLPVFDRCGRKKIPPAPGKIKTNLVFACPILWPFSRRTVWKQHTVSNGSNPAHRNTGENPDPQPGFEAL
jgi:hypothetical protein